MRQNRLRRDSWWFFVVVTIVTSACGPVDAPGEDGGMMRPPRRLDVAPLRAQELTRGPVVVEPVPSWMSGYCATGARKLKFSVPCPSLAPRRGLWVPCRGTDEHLGGSGCFVEPTFLVEKVFRAGKGYTGLAPGRTPAGHMTVWAARYEPRGLGCSAFGQVEGSTEVQGVMGTWFTCPIGSSIDSDHVVLQWSKSGVTYGVGFHGVTPLNRRLAMTVAEGLRFVEPPRS